MCFRIEWLKTVGKFRVGWNLVIWWTSLRGRFDNPGAKQNRGSGQSLIFYSLSLSIRLTA